MTPEEVLQRAGIWDQVPTGSEVIGVWYDTDTDTFRFKLHNPEFPILEELTVPPLLKVL
jgi:hypothetical protein